MPTTHSCVICLEIIGENFTTLKTCGHVFHYGCIEQWVTGSKTCPVCRIKTHSNQMLKLFFEEVHTTDVEKLVTQNQKLFKKLKEKQRMNEALKIENDTLQKQLIETIAEKEECKRHLKVEKKSHKRKLKSVKKELSNCTIDLTYSPPIIPRKKRSKRNQSSGAGDGGVGGEGDATIDLTYTPRAETQEPRKKKSKRNETGDIL